MYLRDVNSFGGASTGNDETEEMEFFIGTDRVQTMMVKLSQLHDLGHIVELTLLFAANGNDLLLFDTL